MLDASQIHFSYPGRKLLHNLNLSLKEGNLIHLVGPNGCGKSTFMRIVAGLLQADRGDISLSPELAKKNNDRRHHIEYVGAESNGLYIKLDAITNLKYWGELRGEKIDLQTIHEELKQWGLNHPLFRENFPVEKYSTGMKRRLCLARLNLSPAKIWLLDEPIYGLDTEAIEVFRKTLKTHLSQGGCCMIVSHDTAPILDQVTETIPFGKKLQEAT